MFEMSTCRKQSFRVVAPEVYIYLYDVDDMKYNMNGAKLFL